MKYRVGYVSNSSSTAFYILLHGKHDKGLLENVRRKIVDMLKKEIDERVDELIEFNDGSVITLFATDLVEPASPVYQYIIGKWFDANPFKVIDGVEVRFFYEV